MDYRLIWDPSARIDLRELASYIAESRPKASASFRRIGMSYRSCLLILIALLLLLTQASWAQVENVIVMIGDGMGFEQVKAASLYACGKEGGLSFEKYYQGEMTTHSANSYRTSSHATDSAAAATSMATGQKVNNGVISQKAGEPVRTILELLQERGKAAGLVTTKYLTDATPAGFAAHASSRSNYRDIANDYLTQARPNILFGAYYANGQGITEAKAKKAQYSVVKTRAEMCYIVGVAEQEPMKEVFVAGLFSTNAMPWEYDFYNPHKTFFAGIKDSSSPGYDVVPHLSEMTTAALNILDNDPEGFFLMVEGARIDTAGHNNNIEYNVYETLEFAKAFQVVLDWAQNREDTLILVTADHECGGLKVVKGRGKGFMPDVFWGSTGHSGANVPIYAAGQGAEEFTGVIDNTEIFTLIVNLTKDVSRIPD